jgi:ATP/maltotriose-dependent transcriptional regulator MalT
MRAAYRLTLKYANLAHPAFLDALLRLRLFAHLKSLREQHGVIWIASPPGAGKTTLAASYLAAHAPDSVWYQIDEGDADPAGFFLSGRIG